MKGHSLKIYQANIYSGYCFMGYEFACKKNADLNTLKEYTLVYEGEFVSGNDNPDEVLGEIFIEGNIGQLRSQMSDFYRRARSISVSDVIELDGSRYYVEPFGFEAIGKGEG